MQSPRLQRTNATVCRRFTLLAMHPYPVAAEKEKKRSHYGIQNPEVICSISIIPCRGYWANLGHRQYN